MAEELPEGRWRARWSGWDVRLHGTGGKWVATVRRGSAGYHVGRGFTSPKDAVAWACDTMRAAGAVVLVLDRPSITLETLLQFRPLMEAVV